MTIAQIWLFFGLVHYSFVQVSLLSEWNLNFPLQKMLDQAFEGSYQGLHEDHKVLKTKTHVMVED
jgi:hypothetical protein